MRIKPGPDHMPARFVRYLVRHAEPYVEHLDKAERDGFAEAVTNLQSDEPGARTRGLMYLRGLCARQGASNLSLELAHWLAGDWFWGEPE